MKPQRLKQYLDNLDKSISDCFLIDTTDFEPLKYRNFTQEQIDDLIIVRVAPVEYDNLKYQLIFVKPMLAN